MRHAGLPFQVVRDQFEERETTSDQSEQDQERAERTRRKRKGKKRDAEEHHEYDDSPESDKEPEAENGRQANPYDTIVLPVEIRPLPPERQTRSKTNPGSRRHWGT